MAEKAPTAVIQEAYPCLGRPEDQVPVRSTTWSRPLGMSGISKSQVSRLCEQIAGKVRAFLRLYSDFVARNFATQNALYVQLRNCAVKGQAASVAKRSGAIEWV